MYSLLIGGAAGQGIDTAAAVLEKALKRSGYHVFTMRDFMSRVRGGHNFITLRFGPEEVPGHSTTFHGILAFNEETVALHQDALTEDGFILCDTAVNTDDPRAIKINMAELARTLGAANAAGSIAVGAALKLFSVELAGIEDILAESIKEKYLAINVQAVQKGHSFAEQRFAYLGGGCKDCLLLTGSRALALGALAAGLKFYAAYPMSPSTTILEYLAAKSAKAGVVVEQAEDEIAAINMAIGASYAGARAMTGTSGGGFSLMVEALGLSGIAEIPLVVVDVQRPGPATGLPTRTEQSDLKFVISASQGEFPRMVIALRNHTDSFYQTIRAFRLAEQYQIPVILLSDQYLGDSSATIPPYDLDGIDVYPCGAADAGQEDYLRYRYTESGISPRLIPGKTNHLVAADSDEHDERGWITESSEVRVKMVDKRAKKLELLVEELQEPEFMGEEGASTLLIGWGSTYGPIREAVALLNKSHGGGYGALVFGDVYPLPQKLLRAHAASAKRILNVEQNATGQLAGLIREYAGIACTGSILKYDGRQISAQEIVTRVLKEGQQ